MKESELVSLYGLPKKNWSDTSYIHLIEFPFPMFLSWSPKIKVTKQPCHDEMKEPLLKALDQMKTHYGVQMIEHLKLNEYGGIYNYREKRGIPNSYSVHSWGLAIDLMPSKGRLGKPSRLPLTVVNIFEACGFTWGGRWKRTDGMHFQIPTTN